MMNDSPIDTNLKIPKFTWRLKDVLFITALSGFILLGGIVGLSLISRMSPSFLNAEGGPTLLYTVSLAGLESAALLLGVYIIGLGRRNLRWSDIGLHRVSRRWLLWAVLITLLMIPIVGLVAMLIQLALGMPVENPQLEFLVPDNFSWGAAIGMLIFGGMVVPVAEEIYFRGVIYRWLRQFTSTWVSIPVSALFFGLMHGEVSVAGASFLMGILLAWFYERSQSLWPSILIHSINNSLKLLILYILLASGVDLQIP